MSLETWQAVPVVTEADRLPIMVTTTDYELERAVMRNVGLPINTIDSGPFTACSPFKGGRLVVARAFALAAIHEKVEPLETQAITGSERWFVAGSHVLQLLGTRRQVCYGNWQPSYRLTVFGS